VNPKRDPALCLGIDVGGSAIKSGLVDCEGRVVFAVSRPTPVGPASALDVMATMLEDLLREAGATRGPLSPSRGIVFHCANLKGWVNVPIREQLSRRLNLPVVFDNDGNLAAFGEYWAGAGKRAGDMIALTLGTGVGCGIIIDGRILHGHHENAAEIGHMIVERHGRPCPCGQRGCLEQYASAAGLAKRAREALEAGAPSVLRDWTDGREEVTSRQVADAARSGDALCRGLWSDACEYLAIACINLQHLVNPAVIVLGGGLAEAGDFLLDAVRDAFRRHRWTLADDFPDIRRAALGYDAGMIGAAGWAWAAWNRAGP
jgi:glucokinase